MQVAPEPSTVEMLRDLVICMHLLMNDLVHKVRRLFREVDEDGNGKVFFFNGKVFVYLFYATAMLCLFFCNGKLLLLFFLQGGGVPQTCPAEK